MERFSWDFKNETVYVSAGAWGIGRAVVSLFARAGAKVVFGDKDRLHGEELVDILESEGAHVRFVEVDFADDEAWPMMMQVGEGWPPSLVICNAGVSGIMPVEALDIERYDRVQAINQRSALIGIKHCVPWLKRRGRGAIVLVGSIMSRSIFPNSVTYVATKAAIEGVAKALAVDLGASRIRVNCVQPGFTRVGMTDEQREHVPPGLWTAFAEHFADFLMKNQEVQQPLAIGIDSSDVANAVAFLCSDLAQCITGVALPIDGGLGLPVSTNPGTRALLGVWTEEMEAWVQEQANQGVIRNGSMALSWKVF